MPLGSPPAPPIAAACEIPRGLQRQANLLAALARQSSLTRREYQLLAGISHTTARHDLAELVVAHLIVRHGRALRPPRIAQQSRNNRATTAPKSLSVSAALAPSALE